jgi:hypothetical protein
MTELIILFAITTVIFLLLFIFYKRSSRKAIVINYLVVLLFGMILPFNLAFSPKTAFYLHAFPLNLNDHYGSSIDYGDISFVFYTEQDGPNGILVYQRVAGLYVSTNQKTHLGIYWNLESEILQAFQITFIDLDDGTLYGLIHKSAMDNLVSLQISGLDIPLTWTEGDEYFVFILDSDVYPFEIVHNGQILNGY